MLIGLIDVDNRHKLNKCFPNLPLMKLSAWHKTNGDLVEWYDAQNHYDIVYMSKVFSFTPDYTEHINADKVSVYVLCNFDTTIEQDLERIMFIRSLNFNPYVMRYDKANIKRGSTINKLARWVNNRYFFWKYETFTEYLEAYDRGETF